MNRVLPLLVMEREHAKRTLRLLRAGEDLALTATIGVAGNGGFTATNVIGEITGRGSGILSRLVPIPQAGILSNSTAVTVLL